MTVSLIRRPAQLLLIASFLILSACATAVGPRITSDALQALDALEPFQGERLEQKGGETNER